MNRTEFFEHLGAATGARSVKPTAEQTIEWLEGKFRDATMKKHAFAHNRRQHAFYSKFADDLAATIVILKDDATDEYGISCRAFEER